MLLNNKNKKYENLEVYYDIDGVAFILSEDRFYQLFVYLKSHVFDIANKGKYSPRIMNSCKISFDNLGCIKKKVSFFLSEVCTYIGRFNMFVVFRSADFDIGIFINRISELMIRKYNSYYMNTGDNIRLTNISLHHIFTIIR